MNNRKYLILDNNVVDVSTGEVLCECIEATGITKLEAFDAALERIAKAEARLVGLRARHSQIKTNIAMIEKKAEGIVEYLHDLYGPALAEYARKHCPPGSKTFRSAYGTVSTRIVKGGLKCIDKVIALKTVKKLKFKNAIKKSEDFLISKLTPEQVELLTTMNASGFEIMPDSETVLIKVVE